MHRFSLIVPILGDDRLLDDTLASVLRYRPDSSQIIVVHDGTYEDPYNLQDEIQFVSAYGRCELPGLLQAALREVSGELIAVVRPGMELNQDWNIAVEACFDDPRIGSVSPIIVAPRRPGRVVSAGVKAGFGSRRVHLGTGKKVGSRTIQKLDPCGPTLWAAFYRRSALEQIGEFAEHQLDSIFVDLDLALSLETLGFHHVVCSECIVTADRPMLITGESTQPHGKSAQRAIRRHAVEPPSFAQTMRVFFAELLTTPFRPWIFRHAMQRLGAWQFRRQDRDFARQLATCSEQKWLQDELGGLSVELTDSSQTDPSQTENIVERRAA